MVVYGALMSLFTVLMGNYKIADSLWVKSVFFSLYYIKFRCQHANLYVREDLVFPT
jgi:hypothetical protein